MSEDNATADEKAAVAAAAKASAAEAQAAAAAEAARYTIDDPALQREWVRQNNLANAGLIGAALIMVEPFLTVARLDVAAKICVVSFAVAIPLLAALVLVGYQEMFRQRLTKSVLVTWFAKPVAQGSWFVGIVAGFWHITWIAGVAMLVVAFDRARGALGGLHAFGTRNAEPAVVSSPGSNLVTTISRRSACAGSGLHGALGDWALTHIVMVSRDAFRYRLAQNSLQVSTERAG